MRCFDPQASYLHLSEVQRTLIGLISVPKCVGRGALTQVCLLPEYRSSGLGEAVAGSNHKEFTRTQLSCDLTDGDEANARAISLYKRIGFTTNRVFDAFLCGKAEESTPALSSQHSALSQIDFGGAAVYRCDKVHFTEGFSP